MPVLENANDRAPCAPKPAGTARAASQGQTMPSASGVHAMLSGGSPRPRPRIGPTLTLAEHDLGDDVDGHAYGHGHGHGDDDARDDDGGGPGGDGSVLLRRGSAADGYERGAEACQKASSGAEGTGCGDRAS